MSIDWEYEAGVGLALEFLNAAFSHFGYVAIAAAAYLFKLTIAATLASYSAFLCATLVGGLVTYFPTRAVMWALESLRLARGAIQATSIVMQCVLSPMVGAYILNLALGWSIPLMPLLAVGGAGLVIGVAVAAIMDACGCCGNNSNQLSSASQGYRSNALLAQPRAKNDLESGAELETSVNFAAIR